MKTIHYRILVLLLMSGAAVNAQTNNFGEFVVAENTIFSNEQAFVNNASASFINDGDSFLYGDLVNNGTLDFTPASVGRTNFVGSSLQDISGSALCFFNEVVFNNTTAGEDNISLNNTIIISSETSFVDGIVNSESDLGEIIFDQNATAVNANDNSFIDGNASKQGDSEFEFPVGDVTFYRPAIVSSSSNLGTEFTTKYFLESPDALFPIANRRTTIDRIDNNEYWTIENTSGTDENVFITLSWNAQTTPAAIIADNQVAIRVLRWNELEQLWENEGGVVDAVNNRVTTLTTLSEYGVFNLGRIDDDFVLPGGVVIYNAISTKADGKNDVFLIGGIGDLSNNKVEIFNRWGAKVFSASDYGSNDDNLFRGVAVRGSNSPDSNDDGFLPTGTYFYVLSYDLTEDGETRRIEDAGYLYLNSD